MAAHPHAGSAVIAPGRRRIGRSRALAAGLLAAATACLAACDGSSSPHPSDSAAPPVAIAACPTAATVPPDTTRVVPSSAAPPTTVIRVGAALSLAASRGSSVGLGAPVGAGDSAVLCRVSSVSVGGTVVLLARKAGFVRLVVASGAKPQLVVNVQVTGG